MTSTGFDADYTDYQVNRSALRKIVRRAYLRSAASLLQGPTLDFGCGAGELLAQLPKGSKGLEYNQATVEHCRDNGLDVDWYDGEPDRWRLSVIPDGRCFESMVVSHVLEHLDAPIEILGRLLSATQRMGVSRVLVIVPGRAGYRIDDTHRTFVDLDMLSAPAVLEGTGFRMQQARYFPGNVRVLGDWFPHHELQVLLVHE
ncbi:MAG: methionine biosynthesis protein MetW [Luteimonas sp.]